MRVKQRIKAVVQELSRIIATAGVPGLIVVVVLAAFGLAGYTIYVISTLVVTLLDYLRST